MQYRADIDGLRAIAVCSVILFHIQSDLLQGGFLGVDIFFVISGYLITFLLAKEYAINDKINFIDFYKRRIQRIFPALLFMILSVVLLGYVFFTPSDYAALLTSSIWSLFSAANIYFFNTLDTSYFAPDSGELPLLHLWSLGVEEQFYIFWPFVVWFLSKYLRTIQSQLIFILGTLIISLLMAEWIRPINFSFAYYLLPSRAWELMTGAAVALLLSKGIFPKKTLAEILAWLGSALVLSSLVLVSKKSAIPGVGAAPVVLGTALLIISGASSRLTSIRKILSLKLLVALGLVSYSAYLWHWPILAFLKYSMIEINFRRGFCVFILTFIMASLSYFIIENPLRKCKINVKKVILSYFTIPVLVVTLFSLATINAIQNKNPLLYPWDKYQAIVLDTRAAYSFQYNCQYSEFKPEAFQLDRCVYPQGSQPNILLVGDSNAAHYLGMLRVFADHYGFSLRNATQSSCPMLFSKKIDWIDERWKKECSLYRKVVENKVAEYDTVIIGGSWNVYDENSNFRAFFKKTIKGLSKKVNKIIILAKNPLFPGYSIKCQERSVRIKGLDCTKNFIKLDETIPINKFLMDLTKNYSNVYYFDAKNSFCKQGKCSPYLNGKPIYFDGWHYSMLGSTRLGEAMIKENNPLLHVFDS